MALRVNALSIAIGITGALVAWALRLPLPFIMGPVIASVIAGRFSMRLDINKHLKLAAFVIIGIYLGSRFSNGFLITLTQYAPAFLLGIATTVITTIVITLLAMRLWRYNFATAAFSSLPGGILVVLDTAANSDADIQAVTFLQIARVAIGATLIPVSVTALGFELMPVVNDAMAFGGARDWLITVPTVAVATLIALKLRVPSGALIAPMITTAILVSTKIVTLSPPAVILLPAFVIASVSIGAALPVPNRGQFAHLMGQSILLFTVATTIGLFAAWVASRMISAPLIETALAFAPAGLTETTTLATAIGLSPDFVAANNLLRLALSSLLAPFILALARARRTASNNR